MWAVDYGVLSLTAFQTPDVLKSVYVRKALQVITTDSRQRIISRRVLTPKGGDEGGGGGEEPGAGTMRKDFRVLAFWIGSVVTDANGQATTDVTLPESLTTYRIMAVAADKASRFGSAESEIRVNKPLTMKPTFPRFLARGDKASFGAVVTSQLKTKGTATVTIKSLDPGILELTGSSKKTIDIGAGGAAEAKFDAVARAVGKARIQMTARLGSESDAFEDAIPVEVLVSPETVAAYGDTATQAKEQVVLPSGVVSGFGGLHMELASTAMVGLGEGARYVVEYPYGCAEQRSSRALALLLAADLGEAFSLPDINPKDLKTISQAQITQLERYQCPGGGFAYWPGECLSVSPYLTSYVLHVFQVAKSLKYKVNDSVMEKAYDYLDAELAKPAPENESWFPAYTAWQAFAVKVLVEGGRNEDSHVNRLYAYLDRMPVFGLTYLADTLVEKGESGPRLTELHRRIKNAILPEGGSAHVEELNDPYLMWFWNSNVRSTAIVLDHYAKQTTPDLDLRAMVRWMMAARKDGRWGNTQENALAMEALVTYYRTQEADVPDFSAAVTLGSDTLMKQAFKGRSDQASTKDVPMKSLLASGSQGSTHDLTFTKTGTGRLFYAARLRYAVDAPRLQGLDSGFAITRTYEPTDPAAKGATGPASTSYKAGDLIRVTLSFDLTKERRYVAVVDPLPAGFEPVESWFATTAHDLANRNDTENEPSDWWLLWEKGRLRSCGEARRPGAALRDTAERRTPRVHVRRARDNGRDVLGRAGARRRDVRARSVRPDGNHRSGREAVKKTLAGALLVSVALTAWIRLGPLPAGLLEEAAAVRSTTVLDRNGQVLYEARSDLGTREERLQPDRLPPALVAATLAAEDHRFYAHPGVDPIAMGRAAWRNIRARDRVEGGSTLTQQVAKLLLDRRTLLATGHVRSRGWLQKIDEAIVALRLEHRLSKPEILALYLNLAPYGNQITGAERASRAYFGMPVSLATPAQAAFLAALPQRPSRFNPWRNFREAATRQRAVVDRMERRGLITPAAAAEARAERLRLADETSPFVAPHFVGMVLADLPDPKPARVVTTLDAELQRTIEGIVHSQRGVLERHGATNVAVVVLDNASSEWLAWEGSGNFDTGDRGGSINGPTVPRQPGSALKTFTYALAFEAGRTPATVLPDIPSSFPTAEEGVVYTPRNYDGRFRGPLLARSALAGSINVPAVWMASELGVPEVLRFLRRAGFTTFDRTGAHYGLGVTLGNAEVRLDELTAAYASFGRGGLWVAPRMVLQTEDRRLKTAESVQLVTPRTAYWIADILSDDDARAFIFGRGSQLDFPFPVAVKTGTSQAYHDNWTVGFSQHVTVGVWVGNFDRTPLVGSSGVTGAGPLFHAVMLAAEARAAGTTSAGGALASRPADLVETSICGLSGMRAQDACPIKRREWLPRDAPQAGSDALACSWHHATERGVATVWPERYRAWADAAGVRSALDRRAAVEPRFVNGAVGPRHETSAPTTVPLHVTSPADGTVFLIDPTLRAEFQAVPLRAIGAGSARLSWAVNGREVGTVTGDASLHWTLERGVQHAVVRDGEGRTADVSFVVK